MRMTRLTWVLALTVPLTLAFVPGVSVAQEQEPAAEPIAPAMPALSLYDFEDQGQAAVWTTAVPEATVRFAAGNARQGRGALEFAYTPPDEAYLEVRGAVAPVAGARTMTFSIKTTQKTSLRFGAIEEDGSLYDGFLALPANQWTDVAIPISDLQLGEEAQDENGRLDAEQITTLYFADLANLPGELGRILGHKDGPQKMWLDGVGLTAEAATSRSKTLRDEQRTQYLLDGFESDLIRFLPMGDVTLTLVAGAPGDGGTRALRMDYQLAERRWIGLVTGAAHLDLTGLQKVRFEASVGNDTRLHVLLEEKDGSRYDAVKDIKQADGWTPVELDVNDFFMGFASTDENAMLDPNQIRVIIFVVDTFNTLVDANGNGSLTLDNIELIAGPR
jgi:hypothetical protein